MQYVILGGLAVAVLFGLVQLYARLNVKTLLQLTRYVVAAVLILGGIGLSFARQFQFGLPAIVFGLVALFRGRLGPLDFGAGSRSLGQASSVKARFVEVTLDHDSGGFVGRVREGRYAGRDLDDLDEDEIKDLYSQVTSDPDSRALLEAYIDRRFPGWRQHSEEDGATGPGGASDSSAMTDEEAYEILGLLPGAGEAEIHAAHRRLLKGVHPDQGGSTFLAARINQAKDWLLGKHR